LFQTAAKAVGTIRISQSDRFLRKFSGDRETDWNPRSTCAASAEMESICGGLISPRIPKSSFDQWCLFIRF
jgi:hypothetical protein